MRSLAALVCLALCGCTYAVSATGHLNLAEDALLIRSMSGNSRTLELDAASQPLHYLDGFLVELEGVTHKGQIQVTSWRVVEGAHGISVWVGTVVRTSEGIALDDTENKARLTLKGAASDPLWDLVGHTVLVEGIIDGPRQVEVVDIRQLDAP